MSSMARTMMMMSSGRRILTRVLTTRGTSTSTQSNPHELIRAIESAEVPVTRANAGEYVRALVTTNRLDDNKTFALLSGALRPAAETRGTSPESPLYTQKVEGGASFGVQLWRTLRALGVAFIVVSGAGAFMEDRGIGKGFGSGKDLEPMKETQTRFTDVKGVDEAKGELEEIVEYLRSPSTFTRLGGKLPKGVLLIGPPGTGKTMLARAVAGEAGVPFFYASGSEFEEMFVGVGARRVRDLFKAAKKNSPCLIFIDEIDAVGGKRNPRDQQYVRMTLNQLLVELDGFKQNEGIIVIAATNTPDALDRALVRPGRFDRQVVVPNPDVEGRRQILESHFKKVPRADDVDLSVIARGTPGFSGADLANLVNLAALRAAVINATAVTQAALEYAKDRIIMGAERRSAVISEENRRLTAYHEGGHALVALFTEGAHPIAKATIVPRGMALGMVAQLPEKDETSVSRKQLLAKLDVAMAGRVAEEMIFGEKEVTTGASSDFQQATNIARHMVMKWGMSETTGLVSYDGNGDISAESKMKIDAEVRRLLTEAYERAKAILQRHEKDLHKLAHELLTKETLSGAQIKALVGQTTSS